MEYLVGCFHCIVHTNFYDTDKLNYRFSFKKLLAGRYFPKSLLGMLDFNTTINICLYIVSYFGHIPQESQSDTFSVVDLDNNSLQD